MKATAIRFDEAVTAANEVGKITLDYFEKLANLQLNAARTYADLAFTNTTAALQVQDFDGAKNYLGKQAEVARGVLEHIAKDSNEVITVARGYAENVQSLVKKSVGEVAVKKGA
jgi:phasin family protein|tara:strand:+ start:163 stop:504 length:342 start_codon:yes stop_codon:yes gene_type:complete